MKKGDVKIESTGQIFKAEFIILQGLFKTQDRSKLRENLKTFKVTQNNAQDSGSMGVRYHAMEGATMLHFHIPSSRNMQLLVSVDLDMKALKKLPMNETYKELIREAYKRAGGKTGIITKLKDAIF